MAEDKEKEQDPYKGMFGDDLPEEKIENKDGDLGSDGGDNGDGGDGDGDGEGEGGEKSPLDLALEGLTPEDIRAKILNDPRIKSTREAMEGDVRKRVQEEAIEARIAAMSQEDIATQIASDPQFATLYANVLANKDARTKQDWSDALVHDSQVMSTSTTIAVYTEAIKTGPFTDEVKAKLQPENFRGEENPIGTFINAYNDALSDVKAHKIYEEELKKNMDADIQERLAKAGGGAPIPQGGRPRRGGLDVMETSSQDLITAGLEENQQKRRA